MNIDKIIENNRRNTDHYTDQEFEDVNVKNAIIQGIKEVIPEILKIVNENAKVNISSPNGDYADEAYNNWEGNIVVIVDEKSIISLQSKIEKELNI